MEECRREWRNEEREARKEKMKWRNARRQEKWCKEGRGMHEELRKVKRRK